MCGSCSDEVSEAKPAAANGQMTLRVDDMTCGHCAATITSAIEKGIPGAKVKADPVSKLVRIEGAGDAARVKVLVAEAGYTPSPA